MIAEYAACYGGPPPPEMKWPLFRALLARTGRFEARTQLTLLRAINLAFDSEGDEAREELVRQAYPVKKSAFSGMVENLASRKLEVPDA